jgi:xanthine dehydrogenase accessory factor
MKEIQDIIQAYNLACNQGKQTALATVVQVDGSSYRRPGARMLVTEDGQLTGAISGGCLEGDAFRKARLVIAQQMAMLVTYDTMDEEDNKLGIGLGCNGVIHILIEPVNAANVYNPVRLLQHLVSRRQPAMVVTLFSVGNRKAAQPGTCLVRLENGSVYGDTPDNFPKEAIFADAWSVFSGSTPVTKKYRYRDSDNAVSALIEHMQPAVSLVIVGAGNDVIPLTDMAGVLGWETTIIDGRANYATQARFPGAKHVIVAKPEKALLPVCIDKRTVFVLMTHNYNYDIAILRQLISFGASYTGVLGPKKKMERMLDELEQRGTAISFKQRAKIFGPVGLDIGGESPAEIALSIVAEIQAVLSGASGETLREKKDAIHIRNTYEAAHESGSLLQTG